MAQLGLESTSPFFGRTRTPAVNTRALRPRSRLTGVRPTGCNQVWNNGGTVKLRPSAPLSGGSCRIAPDVIDFGREVVLVHLPSLPWLSRHPTTLLFPC